MPLERKLLTYYPQVCPSPPSSKAFLPIQEPSEFPQSSCDLLVCWYNPQDVGSGLEASQLPSTFHSLSRFISTFYAYTSKSTSTYTISFTPYNNHVEKRFLPFIHEDNLREVKNLAPNQTVVSGSARICPLII